MIVKALQLVRPSRWGKTTEHMHGTKHPRVYVPSRTDSQELEQHMPCAFT